MVEAGEVRRLASLGFRRAPGESDDELRHRARWSLLDGSPRIGYGSADWWRRRTRAVSWWIRRVDVRYVPMEGTVVLGLHGPLGLGVPGRVKRRVERELAPDKPINVRLVVS